MEIIHLKQKYLQYYRFLFLEKDIKKAKYFYLAFLKCVKYYIKIGCLISVIIFDFGVVASV